MIIGGKQHNLQEEGKRILFVVVFAFHAATTPDLYSTELLFLTVY
jgi:hypothetical protein